jgi:hypothetical protein
LISHFDDAALEGRCMSDAMPQAMPAGRDFAPRSGAARIGLRWGAWFWVPLFAPVLFFAVVALDRGATPANSLQILAVALPALPVLLLCGRWWALRGLNVGEWAFLLAAITQGLVLFGATVLLPLAVLFYGEHIPANGVSSDDLVTFIAGWGICSAWMLALAVLVGWRVRRATARSGAIADTVDAAATPSPGGGLRRFAQILWLSIGIPLLLAIPFVAMLRYDVNQHRDANDLLRSQIVDTVGPQIADLEDLERVKASLLVRKQILETIEPHAASAADALAVIGTLPADVQLVSLRTHGLRIALDVRCSTPNGELAVLELLARGGYRDLRIAARQRERTEPIEQISIEATSMRGGGS